MADNDKATGQGNLVGIYNEIPAELKAKMKKFCDEERWDQRDVVMCGIKMAIETHMKYRDEEMVMFQHKGKIEYLPHGYAKRVQSDMDARGNALNC